MIRKIKNFFLDLFFPKLCLGCQKEGSYLCQDCLSLLEISKSQFCLCKEPKRIPQAGKCPNCRSRKLSGLFAALPYQNPLLQKLIKQLKYEPHLKELAKTLASLIITHFQILEKSPTEIGKGKILVPLPLAKRKLRKRGFNQAEEIARELAKIWKIPLISDCLVKIKETLAQVDLSENQREENIKGAFLVKNKNKIRGKKILLVDDVYTSGATMEEAAKVLIEAGAKEVWGVVVARG